ncbi:hypothetical protein O3P69_006234 [Scylla paramamosain]|uniref:Uncharacterized protein n=1 Tax=Scylla paramamosain TaxID=85552 RepID=A0AAW0U7W5_SCYPA
MVGGKRLGRARVVNPNPSPVETSNRFALLSRDEECAVLIGDSLTRDQEKYFGDVHGTKWMVRRFPGAKNKKLVSEIEKDYLEGKEDGHHCQYKLDGSFSRSRSSSINSLENISSEAIQCLAVTDTYIRKNEGIINPTLWVGTSLGSVIQITFLLPPVDIRSTTPASVHPSGTIFRVKGSVLTMSFLDSSKALIPHRFESWRDEQKERRMDRVMLASVTLVMEVLFRGVKTSASHHKPNHTDQCRSASTHPCLGLFPLWTGASGQHTASASLE